MNKRDFIKTGILGIAGLSITNLKANSFSQSSNNVFSIPKLPYASTEITSIFSEEAFTEHFTKHYISYNKSLNKQLKQLVFKPKNVREILANANQFNPSLVENACGFVNHRLFFRLINPNNRHSSNSELKKEIIKTFGSENSLYLEFTRKTDELNGNGWLWLVLQDSKLKIVSTQNNNNPLLSNIAPEQKGFPLIGIDLWKHAYTPNYGDNSKDYVLSILKNINWKTAEKRYKRAQKIKLS